MLGERKMRIEVMDIGQQNYNVACRLCDKRISDPSYVRLFFNSTQKVYFHKKCFLKFKKGIASFSLRKKFLEIFSNKDGD
jgi:hypothetical protein